MSKKERQPNRKLTGDDVRQIRQRYAAGNVSQFTLAAEFGVGQTLISRVVLNRNWKHA